jgi:hypothetical protein
MIGLRVLPTVLLTEALKLRRTLALRMTVLPLIVVLLYLLLGLFGASTLVRQNPDVWASLTRNSVTLWTLLMLPLFITLETSLLAGLEHSDRNWKYLLTMPVPRWTVYVSKFMVALGLVWIAHLVLFSGTMISGMVLRQFAPELKLVHLPIGAIGWPLAKVSVAVLLAVAIQHWVSLRWPSFIAAMGFGMCAMVIGFMAVNSQDFGPWYPWSLALHTLSPRTTGAIHPTTYSAVGAAVVTILGAWQFSRRDVA